MLSKTIFPNQENFLEILYFTFCFFITDKNSENSAFVFSQKMAKFVMILFVYIMLSLEEIQKVARLSKLELTPDEEKKYQAELSELLGFFEKLENVDTSSVEPLSQVTGLENNLRIDEVQNFDADKLLKCSPREKSQDMVSVPAVF